MPVRETRRLLPVVEDVVARYEFASLRPLLDACRALAATDDLSVAVLGQFKAGKSSLVNALVGRDVMPVGAIPVTAVVSELVAGERGRAVVRYLDGRSAEIPVDRVSAYVAERENPGNAKGVGSLAVELPELARLGGLRLVDTPGLDSAHEHNTDASLAYLPNVALALVVVSAERPLSRQDLDLVATLTRYTPSVVVVVTKIDLVAEADRAEVLAFVRDQLAEAVGTPTRVVAYSTRPGYEALRAAFEAEVVEPARASASDTRRAALSRKLETLAGECREYLSLALASAETVASERDALGRAVADRRLVDELKSQVRLVVRDAVGRTRPAVAARLDTHRAELERRLRAELEARFPAWAASLAAALAAYERWLATSLAAELTGVSGAERDALVAPIDAVGAEVFRMLQGFRDGLSERARAAFGVSLSTTEVEIRVEAPRAPDLHVGRVFDRSWELLSPVLPMRLVSRVVFGHFAGRLPWMVEKNLSRLAAQWEERITVALAEIARVAERRLDELVGTVERLTATREDDAPGIREDLDRLASAFDAGG